MSGGISSRSGVSTDVATGLITANQKASFSAGTVYSLTNAQGAVVFGTTSPSITIDQVGTYLIMGRVRAEYNGATFAASRVLTMNLRRTNNTAANLTNGTVVTDTPIVTTLTSTMGTLNWSTIYITTNSDDVVTIFGGLDTAPTAGSLDIAEASIIAIRLQQ